MEIYVSRDGERWGPYDEDQLAEYLTNGTLTVDDLAWTEGVEDWQPLRDLIGAEAAASYQQARAQAQAQPQAAHGKPRLLTTAAAPGFAIEGARPGLRPAVGSYGAPVMHGQHSLGGRYPLGGQSVYGGLQAAERPSYSGLAWASWIIMGICCVLAIIPMLGFLAWAVVGVAAILAFVFGGIIISRGGTVHGIMIILAGVFTFLFGLIAPIVSSVLFMIGQVDLEEIKRQNEAAKQPAKTAPATPPKPATAPKTGERPETPEPESGP